MVWFLNYSLSLLIYQIKRNECQNVNFELARQKHVNKKLHYFVYNDEDFIVWEKYGKEINRDGILYDVVAMSTGEGKTLITCFKDKKESTVLHHFKLLQKHKRNDKEGKTPLKKLYKFNFFQIENVQSVQCNFFQKNKIALGRNVKPTEAFLKIFIPPPQA